MRLLRAVLLFAALLFAALLNCAATAAETAALAAAEKHNKLLLILSRTTIESHSALINEAQRFLVPRTTRNANIQKVVLNHSIEEAANDKKFELVIELYGEKNLLRSISELATKHFAGRAQVDAYLARERTPKHYTMRDWSDGEYSPGYRFVSTIHRSDDLTREQFDDYWANTHVPLAMKTADYIFRYTNTIVTERLSEDAPDIDGLVGLHYLNEEMESERFSGRNFWPGLKSRLDAFNFMKVFSSRSQTMKELILKSEGAGASQKR